GIWLPRDGYGDMRDRIPWLHGVGPSHVRQRHEPLFGIRVLGADNVHRRAFGDQDVQLARHTVGREDSIHHADAFRYRLRVALRFGRTFGIVPRATSGGQSAA